MQPPNLFFKYIPYIKTLPLQNEYEKNQLLNQHLILDKKDELEIYYAPFDYVNTKAKIMIVGITPGFNQMEEAFIEARKQMDAQSGSNEILKRAKYAASFVGPMRTNLVHMLDTLQLPKYLRITSSSELFSGQKNLLHATSVLKYPVFKNGINYSGLSPNILKNDLLKKHVHLYFEKEISLFQKDVFVIPLGRSVEEVLRYLIKEDLLSQQQILCNFPHPSGANRNRVKQFNAFKEEMTSTIHGFFR